jgi:hypothetical protein
MTTFFITYLSVWATLCVIALILAIRLGWRLEFTHAVYWRALLVPWKLVTFLVAISAMMVIAPWTGDPTWDWFDAGFMAIFAYAGAPWAVGVLYQGLRGW